MEPGVDMTLFQVNFGSCEDGCRGGDRSVKFKLLSSHRELHSVHLFLLGTNDTDNMDICDLGALGDFVPVEYKTSGSSLYVP